jgi:hypothetical protein
VGTENGERFKDVVGTERTASVVMITVSGCKHTGPALDSRRYQIFLVAVGLERGPLSLVRINEKLLEREVAAPV